MLQGSLSISIFVAWKVNWYHCCYCLAEARGVCESASVVILVEGHRIFLRFYLVMWIRFLQILTFELTGYWYSNSWMASWLVTSGFKLSVDTSAQLLKPI